MRYTVLLVLALAGCVSAPRSAPVAEAAAPAQPKQMLFRVSAKAPSATTVYVLGSVHLLSEDAAVLPWQVDSAFARARTVAFETHLDTLQARGLELFVKSTLPAGTTLRDVLPDSLYSALEKLLPDYGINVQRMSRVKPWMVSLMLTQATMSRAKFRPDLGVDLQLHRRAKESAKRIVGLESADFQLNLFDNISAADQQLMLVDQLVSPDSAVRSLTTIKNAWMAGDTTTIGTHMRKTLEKSPTLRAVFLDQRNRSWIPAIETLLAGPDDALVVVGAGHLIGPESVLDLLRRKGYKVEQM